MIDRLQYLTGFFLIALSLLLMSSYFLLMFSSAAESKALHESSSRHKIMEAYGRIANNQIINNSSNSWIQSGLWYMNISYNETDNSESAYFFTDFKMVRADGNLLHEHFIKDFKSTNIHIEKELIIINGIADIYSENSLDYKEVPIIVSLKNNTVLGLTIDMDKTQKHFASSSASEMLGVLIESRSGQTSTFNTTIELIQRNELMQF